jgi:hypothetical protein
MRFKRPDHDQMRAGLAALKYVALCDNVEMEPSERRMVDAVQRVLGSDFDIDAIEPLGPAEVARLIDDPQIRHQLVCALIVLSLIDGEATEMEAMLVDAFAYALGVEERAVKNLRQAARHETMAVRLDIGRRFWSTDKVRERIAEHGLRAAFDFACSLVGRHEDAALAAKFGAMRSLPEGTLGREYVRFLDERGWPLPGERGAVSDIIAYHDMTHVLSGYGTDPEGEVQVACFSAGYRKKDGFAFIIFVLLQFHAGIRMTPVAKAERGLFDVERALRAFQRGAAMNVDLTESWDYWAVAEVPIDELRRRYNIPAAA